MNTTAIVSSLPVPGADATKPQFRDNASTTPFNHILNKEIADRNGTETASASSTSGTSNTSATKPSASASKQEQPNDASSSRSVDSSKTKETADTDKTDQELSAEQILMMAAQFIPVNLEAAISGAAGKATTTVSSATRLGSELAARLANALPSASETSGQTTDLPIDLTATQAFSISTGIVKDKPGVELTDAQTGSKLTTDTELAQGLATGGAGQRLATDLATSSQTGDNAMENLAFSTADLAAKELAAEAAQDSNADFSAALSPLQQAAKSLAQAVSASVSDNITPRVGTPGWHQPLGQKIVWMIGNELQSASLTLNPPDLGPMQVVLSVSSTQANASFYSPHAEVREALEAALPKLRDMLGDAGIQLGQANVNAGTPQQQGSFAASMPTTHRTDSSSDMANSVQTSTTTAPRIIREGLVDTFA